MKYISELDFFGIYKNNVNLYDPEQIIINKFSLLYNDFKQSVESGNLRGPKGYDGKMGAHGKPGIDCICEKMK